MIQAGQLSKTSQSPGEVGTGSRPALTAVQQKDVRSKINHTSIARVHADRLTDRNYLVTAGTIIPCVMQTAIDSTQVGLVSCVMSTSIFSDNGNVLLMEKGTRVLGQYVGGVQQGQSRLFISWNRAVTPKSVTIDLSSPAADPLGRSGIDGKTETFFWKRFGGSLLLSILGDLGNAASNLASSARETSNAPNEAAAIALENSINIQPIIKVAQGKEITIFVANDLDFSSVYRLNLAE